MNLAQPTSPQTPRDELTSQCAQAIWTLIDDPEALRRKLVFLIERGLDLNDAIEFRQSAFGKSFFDARAMRLPLFHLAAAWRAWSVLPLFLLHCDPNARDDRQRTPLMAALDEPCPAASFIDSRQRAIDALIPFSDLSAVDERGRDALMRACAGADPRSISALLPGSDPTRVDRDGQNALMIATELSVGPVALRAEFESQIHALAQACDLAQRDRLGRQFAHLAAPHQSRAVVEIFTSNPALAQSLDPHGRSPLMIAASSPHAPCLGLILQASNPRAVDAFGRDALMLAIEQRHPGAARALIPVSDLTLSDARFESALQKSVLFELPEITALLLPLDLAQREAKTLRSLAATATPAPNLNRL